MEVVDLITPLVAMAALVISAFTFRQVKNYGLRQETAAESMRDSAHRIEVAQQRIEVAKQQIEALRRG